MLKMILTNKLARISDIKHYINNNLDLSEVSANNDNPSSSADIKKYVDGEIDIVNSAINLKQDSLTFGLDVGNSLKNELTLISDDILVCGNEGIIPLEIEKGSIIVGNDSKKPYKLSVGQEGQVLTVDSSKNISWRKAAGHDVVNGVFKSKITNIENGTTDEGEIDLSLEKGVEFFYIKDSDINIIHKRIIKDGTEGQVVHVLYETAGASLRLILEKIKK